MSGWEIITITSGDHDSGSDATIYASLNTDLGPTEEIELNSVNTSVHNNVFGRGNFDNFLVNFNVSESSIPESIVLRSAGNDMWRCLRVYVMERSSGRIYSTPVETHELEQSSALLSLSPCKEIDNTPSITDSKAKDLSITIKTSSTSGASTDDEVYVKVISKDGISSELIHFEHIGNDWQAGNTGKYLLTLPREVARIDYVLLFKKANNDWLPESVIVEKTLVDGLYPSTKGINVNNIWLNGDDVGRQNYIELPMDIL